jgi:hypothetical protein
MRWSGITGSGVDQCATTADVDTGAQRTCHLDQGRERHGPVQ